MSSFCKPSNYTNEEWIEHCQKADEFYANRCSCIGCKKIIQKETSQFAPIGWFRRPSDWGREFVYACSLECIKTEWKQQE